MGAGIVLFGPVILWIYGGFRLNIVPVYPALIILLVGYGVANVFFWNRTLLLSFNQTKYPFQVMLWTGLVKVALGLWVIPHLGYFGAAALLSIYLTVSVGVITVKGLRMIPAE
jgi:O-antigen/teichoic acid export membrane protein